MYTFHMKAKRNTKLCFFYLELLSSDSIIHDGPPPPPPAAPPPSSAVSLLSFAGQTGPCVLLLRKTGRGRHAAQLCLPGGFADDRDGGDVDHTDTADGSYTQTCEVERRAAQGGGGGGHGAACGVHQARGWRMQFGATLRARAHFGKPLESAALAKERSKVRGREALPR